MVQLKSDFTPAVLKEHGYRWFIEFYHKGRRCRPTFSLNRIFNLNLRRERGQQLCDLLNWWMSAGLDLDRFSEFEAIRRKNEAKSAQVAPRGHTPLQEALRYAVEVKRAKLGDNPDSMRSYESHARGFIEFLSKQGWQHMPVDELRRHHIMAYIDHRQMVDKVRSITINNNIGSIKAMFTELKDRAFVIDDPTENIKKLRAEPKLKRMFSKEEAKVVLLYLYDHDHMLLLAILFQYCCYMRPKGICKLQLRDIDLEAGIVYVRAEKTKTGRKVGGRTPTIPQDFLPYFRGLMPKGAPELYIFGKGYKPAQKEPLPNGRFYKRHQRMLKKLQKDGHLSDITGLTFYSWKDTGMTEALHHIPAVSVRDQAGHTSINMTLRYYHAPKVNVHMHKMKNDVLPEIEKGPTNDTPDLQ